MKYLENEFYRGRWYFGNQSSATIKNWFKVKDTFFRGIKHVTKRYRRSIAIRDLKRLYKCAFIELLCAEMEFDEGAFDSHHGIDCKWVKKRRIYVYRY